MCDLGIADMQKTVSGFRFCRGDVKFKISFVPLDHGKPVGMAAGQCTYADHMGFFPSGQSESTVCIGSCDISSVGDTDSG